VQNKGDGKVGHWRRRSLAGNTPVPAARRKHARLDLSWPSRLGFEQDQAWELGIGTANTSGHLWRWIRAWLGHYDGEGGWGRRTTPACARSRRYRLPKATISGAKGPEKEGEAHQGLVVAGVTAEDGRRRWPRGGGGRVLADRRLQTGSESRVALDCFRGLLRRCTGG
jgi:hypothetical protein